MVGHIERGVQESTMDGIERIRQFVWDGGYGDGMECQEVAFDIFISVVIALPCTILTMHSSHLPHL